MARGIVGVLMLACLLGASGRAGAGDEQLVPEWIKWRPDKQTVEVWLKAAYNGNNGSWNFNGFYDGGATVVVPAGITVLAHFENPDANFPHSLVVTKAYPEDQIPDEAGREAAAISRAYTRNPTGGCQSCKEDLRFKAKPAGEYYFFCGVVSHGQAGMWIRFTISDEASEPHVVIAEGVIKTGDQPPWR